MNEDSDKYANFSHEELVAEIKRLKKNKKYGLVWEYKKEQVIEDFETQQPYLQEATEKRIENAPGEPTNLIIEGDNFEALSILNYTHAGKVDVIYIDPPYNTGNKDFIYNDNYVDSEDEFRHSKWLSFMGPRLKLAKNLLKDDGVIFISIDEHEFAQLKILCDKEFSSDNYVENFVWIKNATKNLSKTTSTNHEYVLCYAKNLSYFVTSGQRFRTKKEGLEEVEKLLDYCKLNNISIEETEAKVRELYRSDEKYKSLSLYNFVDEDYRLYTSDNPSAPVAKGVSKNNFDIIHPVTGKPCRKTNRGWGFSYEKSLELIKNNMLIFGDDENKIPRIKRYLDTVTSEVQKSIIVDNIDGKKELQKVFSSNDIFQNPKPTTLIKTLVKTFRNDMTIVDFFAGSGTTGQAVLELNKEDGGHRQFILCTNNGDKGPDSVKIAEDITYPRIKTVIKGKRQDGSKYSEGIPASLRYYKIEHKEKKASIDANRLEIVRYLEDIIQVKENSFEQCEVDEDFALYKNSERFVGMVFDPFALEEIIESIKEKNSENKPVKLYVFSYSRDAFEDNYGTDFEIEFVAMPEGLLKTYANIVAETKKEDA